MSRDGLRTYLNDHLAGSVMAIEMAERTIRENEGAPVAELRGLDLDLLERRAVEQHDDVEAMRLEAAKAAL